MSRESVRKHQLSNISSGPLAYLFGARMPETLLVLVAALTRLWRLDYHSFWFDESVSLGWATSDPRHTWDVTFRLLEDKHPPAYYLTLHYWQQLLGLVGLEKNDTALRMLGSLFGVLTVLGLYLLVNRLSGRKVGLLAGLLVAFSPVMVWYSQELRMFQPAATGIVWGAYCLVRATGASTQTNHSPADESNIRRLLWWLGMILALEYALYSYLFSALVLPAAGLTLLWIVWVQNRQKRTLAWRTLWEGVVALGITGGLFLPLAYNAWVVNSNESTPGQAFAGFVANLWRQLRIFTLWRAEWPDMAITGALILLVGLFLAGLLLKDRHSEGLDRWFVLLWIGLPLLLGGILQATNQSVFKEDRYFLFLAPFVLWMIARGAVMLGQRWPKVGLSSGLVATLLVVLALPQVWSPTYQRENWRAASDYIVAYQERSPRLSAAGVAHVDYTMRALDWYLRQHLSFEQLPVFALFGDVLTEADMDSVIGPPLAGIESSLGSHTLWLTQSHLAALDDAGLVERWLDEHYPIITEQFPAGIKLTGYALRSRYPKLPQLADGASYPNAELAPGVLVAACEVLTPRVAAQDTSMHPPSGWVHVRAWMQATESPARNYEIVSQVVNQEGVWGQSLVRDNDVLHRYPTSQWIVGEFVRIEFDVNLNPVAPPGNYAVTLEAPGEGNGAISCGRVDIE